MTSMRARLAAVLVALLFVPMVSATLIDGGEVHSTSRVMAWYDLGEGNVLTLDENGVVVEYTWVEGVLQTVKQIDLNLTVNAARLDLAAGFLAVGHDEGAVVLDLDTDSIVRDHMTADPVEDLDWDDGGDLWLVHNGGLRFAAEYGQQGATGLQTTMMNAGISKLVVLDDGRILTGSFDGVLLIHADDASLASQLQGLGGSVTALVEDGLYLWIGISDGTVHRYSTVTWEGAEVSSSSTPVKSINLGADEGAWVGHQNGHVRHFDDDLNLSANHQVTGSVISVTINDDDSLYVISSTTSNTRVRLLDVDTDGDGVADGQDAFPQDPLQSADSDGDGYGDLAEVAGGDQFPNDPTQWADRDGDGHGDEADGNNPDAFPDDPLQWADGDGDGVGDNPDDPAGDAFPEDSTQWADQDRDGYGDNPQGYRPDTCPEQNGFSTNDRYGCPDRDLDGWSDPDASWDAARGADAFPTDRSQWVDSDGDGYGDAQDGERADACPSVAGASIQALVPILEEVTRYAAEPMYGCPDEDGDGWADASEIGEGMASNPDDYLDQDGDGVGQRTDYNDLNPLVTTHEDHCQLNFDDVTDYCLGIRNTEYQDYLSTLNESERSRMSYTYWNATVANGAQTGGLDMDLVKQVAMLGVVIFLCMSLAILTVSSVNKRRTTSAAEAQKTFVGFGDADQISEEALTGKAGLSAHGGVEEDGLWTDDPLAELAPEEGSSVLPDDPLGISEEGPQEAQDLPEDSATGPDEDPQEEAPSNIEAQEESSQPAAGGPPVPAEGLPEGWSMEQWQHYGHQWLEKNGRA